MLGTGVICAAVGSQVLGALVRDLEARLVRINLVVFVDIVVVLEPFVTLSEEFFLLLLHIHVAGKLRFYFNWCHS